MAVTVGVAPAAKSKYEPNANVFGELACCVKKNDPDVPATMLVGLAKVVSSVNV